MQNWPHSHRESSLLSESSYYTCLTSAPYRDSPDRLATVALGPTSFSHQSDSPMSIFHMLDPREERATPLPQGPQPGDGIWDSQVVVQQHHDENQDIELDQPNPNRYVCTLGCERQFGRLTDLERHLRTSRIHNQGPRGPACPVDSCSYTSKFTRVDNFKAHCMKQHWMSRDETDSFIREWRDRGMP